MVLSRQMAEEFYKEHREKPFFNQLVEFMSRFVHPWTQLDRRVRGSTADWPQLPRAIQLLTALLTNVIILTPYDQDRRRLEAAKSISVSLFIPEHTQIDAQTELSSAPVNLLTRVVTQALSHKGQSDGWDGALQAEKLYLLPPISGLKINVLLFETLLKLCLIGYTFILSASSCLCCTCGIHL